MENRSVLKKEECIQYFIVTEQLPFVYSFNTIFHGELMKFLSESFHEFPAVHFKVVLLTILTWKNLCFTEFSTKKKVKISNYGNKFTKNMGLPLILCS